MFVMQFMFCVIFFFFFQAEDGIRDDLVTGVQTCALPILQRLVEKGEGGAVELLHDGAHPLLGFSAGRPLGDDGAHHVARSTARRFTVASAPPSWARVRRNDGAWRWRPMPSAGAPPRPGSPRSRWSRTEEAAPARGGCLRRPIPRRPTRSSGSSSVSRWRPAAASRGSPPRPHAAGSRAASYP